MPHQSVNIAPNTFLVIDGAFLGANLIKITHGGWLPLVIGAFVFTLMTTWKTGRRLMGERLNERAIPLDAFVKAVGTAPPLRVPGTAVFMTADVRRDMSRQWIEVTFNYQWFDPRGREHKEKLVFEMTAIFPRELQLLVERNGLVIERMLKIVSRSMARLSS